MNKKALIWIIVVVAAIVLAFMLFSGSSESDVGSVENGESGSEESAEEETDLETSDDVLDEIDEALEGF